MLKLILSLGVICTLCTNCGHPYPKFYTLSPIGESPDRNGLGIGVGPVLLADYVDRENLVIQTGPNTLEVAKDHLWAGDLDNDVARVIAINLGHLLNTGNVQAYPWLNDSELDYQIAMDVRRFMAGDDGYAHLEVAWRIYSLPSRKLKTSRTFVGKEPIERAQFTSMVAAQSKLIGNLSKDIAKAIR